MTETEARQRLKQSVVSKSATRLFTYWLEKTGDVGRAYNLAVASYRDEATYQRLKREVF